MLYGIKVYVSQCCVTIPWILPKEPFFEWEEKDVPFCKKYRIGKSGKPEPCAYQIGKDSIIMHPKIYEQFKDQLPEPTNIREEILGGIPIPRPVLLSI